MKQIKLLLLMLLSNITCATDKWIVVTTINYPTEALKKLTEEKDWKLLVVADKKTPKDWHLDGCEFLSVEKQLTLNYKICSIMPWNHYCRKNIGYLYAIEHGAKIIYETDDDNIITQPLNFLPETYKVKIPTTLSKVYNVYKYFGQPNAWPRGYPLEHILDDQNNIGFNYAEINIPVQQGLVNEDPDVDAIYRLTGKLPFNFIHNDTIALPKNVFCPYNTQNTFYFYRAFWGLLIPKTTSFRCCDIWRGYFVQRILWDFDSYICFTTPTAIQIRNQHNYLKDFEDEIQLYCKAGIMLNVLNNWVSRSNNIFDKIRELAEVFVQNQIYQKEELEFIDAWLTDLQNIGYNTNNN